MGLLKDQPTSGPLAFDSMEDGIRAGIKLCYTYQNREWDSPALFIPRFSPANAGNPTVQYIANVCEWTGFKPGQSLDFHDPVTLVHWAQAIFRQEQGPANGITAQQILAAKALADE